MIDLDLEDRDNVRWARKHALIDKDDFNESRKKKDKPGTLK